MVFPYCRGPERLTVWRQQGDWFRITPDGFPYEGWVQVDEVDLDDKQAVDVTPPYLEMIERSYKRREHRRNPRACAVLVRDVFDAYASPAGPKLGRMCGGVPCFREGLIVEVHDQVPGWYEVFYLLRKSDTDADFERPAWLPAEAVSEPVPPFQSGPACLQEISPQRKVILKSEGAFRRAPANELSPESFYSQGATVKVGARYAGGWLRIDRSMAESRPERWFPERDANSSYSFPISARTARGSLEVRSSASEHAGVLMTLDREGSMLVVFEEQGSWLRITPDGFVPAAWVAASSVALLPGTSVDRSAIEYYLAALGL